MAEHAADLHVSVMVNEVLACMQPTSGGIYVDGTLGLGGHSQAILEKSAPAGQVIGFEWDNEAAALAQTVSTPLLIGCTLSGHPMLMCLMR